jgi:hypothetical protein
MEIKSNMNNKRTEFNWDHLGIFYNFTSNIWSSNMVTYYIYLK